MRARPATTHDVKRRGALAVGQCPFCFFTKNYFFFAFFFAFFLAAIVQLL
jgi:hypothetical protein